MRRTAVWISRDEIVDFLEYDASSASYGKLMMQKEAGVAHTGSLGSNALEDVVDEGVEDGHRLVGDTSIRVDLLED